MRTTHLVAAWCSCGADRRLFLCFTGNPWARWDQFVPWRSDRRLAAAHPAVLPVPGAGTGAGGRAQPMAGVAYLALFCVLVAQILTGIALMAVQDNGGGWQATLTGWFSGWLPLPQGRFVHHLLMWVIWTFVITHIYAATLSDRIERSGEVSSMVGAGTASPGAGRRGTGPGRGAPPSPVHPPMTPAMTPPMTLPSDLAGAGARARRRQRAVHDEGLGCVAARPIRELDCRGSRSSTAARWGSPCWPSLAGRDAVLVLDATVGRGGLPGELLVLLGRRSGEPPPERVRPPDRGVGGAGRGGVRGEPPRASPPSGWSRSASRPGTG